MQQLLLLLLLIPALAVSLTTVCPSGFSLINGNKCVRIIKNNLKHGEAERDCKYLGGTLAIVHNSIDNRAISTFAASAGAANVWLGLYCFSNSTAGCYWDNASGTAASNYYSSFIPGHPQVSGGFGGCVYMTTSNGQWVSAKCDVVGLPFVCETPVTYNDTCTHNYGGHCYLPSQEFPKKSQNLTYPKAQAYCQSINANLVSIHSKMELDYIRTVYRASSTNVSQFFLGAKAVLPDTFNWEDGTPWDTDYSNPMSKVQANCMVMDGQGVGLWTQVNCQTINYFMCKRRAGSSGDSIVPPAIQSPQKRVSVDVSDFSNCNATFLLAPGIFTSPNYPDSFPVSYCSYSLKTLGAYNLAVYFTDLSITYANLNVYDEYGNNLLQPPFGVSVIAPTNVATVTFKWDGFGNPGHGFDATFLGV